jgi:hypothetical protein
VKAPDQVNESVIAATSEAGLTFGEPRRHGDVRGATLDVAYKAAGGLDVVEGSGRGFALTTQVA